MKKQVIAQQGTVKLWFIHCEDEGRVFVVTKDGRATGYFSGCNAAYEAWSKEVTDGDLR
jgi:hypothetical protein